MSDYFQDRMKFLADKYGIANQKLQLVNDPIPHDDGSRPLDEVAKDFANEQNKGSKLKVATASTGFKTSNGKALTRLWFDVKL